MSRAEQAMEIVVSLIKSWISDPEMLGVEHKLFGRIRVLYITPTQRDISKVIGSEGLVFRSIFGLVKAMAGPEQVTIEVRDPVQKEGNGHLQPLDMEKLTSSVLTACRLGLHPMATLKVENMAMCTIMTAGAPVNDILAEDMREKMQVVLNAINRTHRCMLKFFVDKTE